jgi:DMSO/TMAO reductase YedYZ molybdopterin-dependent catalytic subunit
MNSVQPEPCFFEDMPQEDCGNPIYIHGRAACATGPDRTARVEVINRRQLLVRLCGASAVFTVVGAAIQAAPVNEHQKNSAGAPTAARWSQTHSFPNDEDAVKPVPGNRPEFTPIESHFRMDIAASPPSVNEEVWRVRISGRVSRPLSYTLGDLRKFEPLLQFVTLACVTNPIGGPLIGTNLWTGVSLQQILREVEPHPRATHLRFASADGFYEVVALETVRRDARAMLTYAWDGVPLTAVHGFPLRLYVPDRYGMKLPKWIQSIEVIGSPEKGYWVERGWDAEARVRATAFIDTSPGGNRIAGQAGQAVVPLGGFAHAGARGISKVQVRVDKKPWREAQLRTPLSDSTWVVWRYDWPFESGQHTFTVRCFEGDGTPQITTVAGPHPSGATGLHSVEVRL